MRDDAPGCPAPPPSTIPATGDDRPGAPLLAAGPWIDAAAALPADPGAYLLALWLASPAPLPPRFAGHPPLPPGWYVYAGSAHGPGGLRARVGRHLRPDKPRRWHVDWITAVATRRLARLLPGGTECAPVMVLLAHAPPARVPVPGFGSSDCRACPAHLLALSDDLAATLGLPSPVSSVLRLS
ncbi:GIY-YIG nuclease family protein [Roseospira visakhapatnamensis]|uniref:Uri superfamily endonuclease n=1 Tax=Roseospira visakhapatnamensis TaxID=390880 RepID=A0A7W6RDA3_9PROT|nr:GIY-YIG nuclease family protein [Roseospira visakhapatnamensis]MBB4266205.1 Uri superfamily endonuclease [Roseospira visakhapatnamensis]